MSILRIVVWKLYVLGLYVPVGSFDILNLRGLMSLMKLGEGLCEIAGTL